MLKRFLQSGFWNFRTASTYISQLEVLVDAPEPILQAVEAHGVTCLPASPRPKEHMRYLVGDDVMLHVYGTRAHPALSRSVPERLMLQSQCNDPGIPRLLSVAFTPQKVWLMEERFHGSSCTAAMASGDLHQAVELLGTLAQVEGPPLRKTAFWKSHRKESITEAPAALRPCIEQAWETVGEIRARPLHGDVRPKNLIKGPRQIGLVDWEGCWRHGLPGLDIAYLLTMNGRRGLDPVVNDMLADRPHPCRNLLTDALLRCGYTSRTIKPAMLVMTALWSLGEIRRERLRRGSSRSSRFRDLLAARLGLFWWWLFDFTGAIA